MKPRLVYKEQKLSIVGCTQAQKAAWQTLPGVGYSSRDPYNFGHALKPLDFPPTPKMARYLIEKLALDFSADVANFIADGTALRQRLRTLHGNEQGTTKTADNLYPHQVAAIQHIQAMRRVLLADEMGLGKTVTALRAIGKDAEDCLNVVVLPKNLAANWHEEIHRWLGPDITVWRCETPTKRKSILPTKPTKGIMLINWDGLKDLQANMPKKIVWLVGDEAHMMKNRKAQRTQAFQNLAHAAENVILLTGTPIESKPSDLWALLHALDPKTFSSYWAFFVTFNDYDVTQAGVVVKGLKYRNVLADFIAPRYVRRTRASTLNMKEPQIIRLPVEMYPAQYAWYQLVLTETIIPEWDLNIPNTIARLTRLRQVAVDASLVGTDLVPSAKYDALGDFVSGLDDDEKLIVFTSFREAARRATGFVPNSISWLSGDDPNVLATWTSTHQILVSTVQSLGVGQNFQAASKMVFLDLPWSSVAFKQAVGRIARIGQTKSPLVYVLTHVDTVDDFVFRLLTAKIKTAKKLDEVTIYRMFKESYDPTNLSQASFWSDSQGFPHQYSMVP